MSTSSRSTVTKAPPARKSKPVGGRRDFAAMEKRRMAAADLFAKGVRQVDIARELGVAHQTVSDWHELWEQGGTEALNLDAPIDLR